MMKFNDEAIEQCENTRTTAMNHSMSALPHSFKDEFLNGHARRGATSWARGTGSLISDALAYINKDSKAHVSQLAGAIISRP